MPKKTKKEKIIADLRRQLGSVKTVSEEVKFEKKKEISSNNYSATLIPSGNKSVSYLASDLRKTIFLAGLAISLELVVYWITELGGSKFFGFLPIFK